MSHERVALAIAVVSSVYRTVAAAPCAPRAELGGDPAAVARVETELHRLGVDTGQPAPGCRAVVARVELDRDGGIAVAIVDGSRRSEGRVVTDPGVAAAWIDSWLRDDVDGLGPFAPARATPSRARVATTSAAPGVVPPAERDDAGAPAPAFHARLAFGAAYEHAWAPDGSSSNGGGASACVHVGPGCLGVAAQYLREADRVVNQTAMRRSDASVVATASWSIRVGQMAVVPELGVGVGRRATARVERCVALSDGNQCVDTNVRVYVGDHLDVATYTPRLAGALRLAVPMFDQVWLEGRAELTLAAFGHSDGFWPTADSIPYVPPSELVIPGEPGRAFQLGVGLRIGAP